MRAITIQTKTDSCVNAMRIRYVRVLAESHSRSACEGWKQHGYSVLCYLKRTMGKSIVLLAIRLRIYCWASKASTSGTRSYFFAFFFLLLLLLASQSSCFQVWNTYPTHEELDCEQVTGKRERDREKERINKQIRYESNAYCITIYWSDNTHPHCQNSAKTHQLAFTMPSKIAFSFHSFSPFSFVHVRRYIER